MGRKIIYDTYREIIFIKTLYTRTSMTFLKIKIKQIYSFYTLQTKYYMCNVVGQSSIDSSCKNMFIRF